jgi:hypothetical protein
MRSTLETDLSVKFLFWPRAADLGIAAKSSAIWGTPACVPEATCLANTDTTRLERDASTFVNPWYRVMINIENFLIEIDQIPWFANIGKPSHLDGQALRITSWEAWPGPETPGSDLIAEAANSRRAQLLATGEPPMIEAVWQRIYERVFERAAVGAPYKDEEDIWYAPNAAVEYAAFNAALVGISGSLGIDLDRDSLGANGR